MPPARRIFNKCPNASSDIRPDSARLTVLSDTPDIFANSVCDTHEPRRSCV